MKSKLSVAHVGLAIFIVVVVGISCGEAVSAEDKVDDTIYVDAGDVVQDNFLGVGVQWSSYPWWDVSDEDWDKVFKRVEYMRLPFVRVMLDAFWYCRGFDKNGRPTYDWNTSYMKKLCKLLDWCEENGAVVLIGEWGRPEGKDIFPKPTKMLKDVDLISGVTVELPSKGVVILTTMEEGASIRLR